MIELDGVPYTVKTPAENSQDMVDRINTYCANNNILSSKGETVYIEQNMASPIYLLLWALGYLVTVIQNLVYSIGKSHSVASSSEKELLNLATLSGIKRGKPSLTTFSAMVSAMREDDENYDATANNGNLVISSEDTITYDGVVYYPAVYPNITLAPSETAYITFVATEQGSYNISAGSITGFDSDIANLGAFIQDASVPGQEQESVASLRERIQRRQYSGSSIDTAMDRIRELEGVTLCNIYYNDATQGSISIGVDNISVPARHALCIVQGYNQKIAQTFYETICAPSVTASDVGIAYDKRLLEVQHYVSHANQTIPLIILKPAQADITIYVHINQSVDGSIEAAMKTAICTVAKGLTAGQAVTSEMVLSVLREQFGSYGLIGVQLMGGKTTSLSFKAVPHEDELFMFNANNIFIVMPEVSNT